MAAFEINNVKIEFPFEPYDIQKDYMRKVIECLQNRTHAVLESPTGTGKTLSLLCSTLGWLMKEKLENFSRNTTDNIEKVLSLVQSQLDPRQGYSAVPKIIYSSRTHSQLSQAMSELKSTVYKNMIQASILGSREQLCLKREVLEETSNVLQNNLCRSLVMQRQCSYYHGVEKMKDNIGSTNKIVDIEDLGQLGRKYHFCPYYMARGLKVNSDLIFMPYNYLLDATTRKTFDIDLYNSVIILDEAHNVEKICEESSSIQITSTVIAMAIEELTGLMKSMDEDRKFDFDGDEPLKDFTLENLAEMKLLLLEYEKVIDGIEVKSSEGDTYDGHYMQSLLERAGINFTERRTTIHYTEKVLQYLGALQSATFNRTGQYLGKIKDMLCMIDDNDKDLLRDKVKQCFRVHIQVEVVNKEKMKTGWQTKIKEKKQKIINFWCFSPGFGMSSLIRAGARNIILTSGTLAPIKPLITELELDAPTQLENPHIVTKEQVLVKIVSKGYRNILLDSSYKNRDNMEYITSLGRTVKTFSRMIPGGLLVFFPSYPILNTCSENWQQSGIWSEICTEKPIFVEPRKKEDFINIMTEYYGRIKAPNSKGACFFAVCRGKVSEGLDFADDNGRGVIIIGLPFPPLKDPRVVLKRKYLDSNRNSVVNGQKWYTLEAIRAVNQAIGRVIRHKDDYGVILLCDHRFDQSHLKQELSRWLRDQIIPTTTWPEAIVGVSKFFHVAKTKFSTTNDFNNDANSNKASTSKFFYDRDETAFGKVGSNKASTNNVSLNENSIKSILNEYKLNTKKRIEENSSPNDALMGFSTLEQISTEANSDIAQAQKRRKINLIAAEKSKQMPTSNSNTNAVASKNLVVKVEKNLKPLEKKIFHETILNYKKNLDIYELIEGLHRCFADRTDADQYLDDITFFIGNNDKRIYEMYINTRKKWDLLSTEERSIKNYNDYLLTKN